MSKTYTASYHKPGRPTAITFHTPEAEAECIERAAALGLTMQDSIDKLLKEELQEFPDKKTR
jgi:hypothetical protein